MRVKVYSFSNLGGILALRGLGWLPDGSQVFGVLNRTTSYALAVVANPTVVQPDATTTTLNCSLGSSLTIGQATPCTAVVTDTVAGGTTPTGVVAVASDTSGGSFSGSSCTLSPASNAGQAACSFSYTPGEAGTGTQTITASYGGDGTHYPGSGQAAITVTLRATGTVLTCTQVRGGLNDCTATVSDTSPGSATAPSGTVSFAGSGPGYFNATQCTLSGSGMSASCTVSYKESAGGPKSGQTISAFYGGDSTHQASAGTVTLT